MRFLSDLVKYVAGPICTKGWRTLIPNADLKQMMDSYLKEYVFTWALFGVVGVLLGYLFSFYSNNPYFFEAAKQVLAPLLWNLVVLLGLIFAFLGVLLYGFGLSFISKILKRSSYAILKFSSEVGALGFGAALGLIVLAFYNSNMGFLSYLLAGVGVVLITVVFFLNVVVWWVAYCLREGVSMPEYFSYVGRRRFLLISICVFSISVFLSLSLLVEPSNVG